jgi:hypothetical protein
MIGPRIVAIVGLLAAGVRAGPCKPSPVVTTTTETTATHVASTTGTAISGDMATTTETTLAPSSTASSCVNNEKTPFPADVLCDTRGIGQDPSMLYLRTVTVDATVAHCREVCQDTDGCIAFAVQPDVFCELWGGSVKQTDGSNTAWSWYFLDCFCDLSDESTTTATTDTTSLTTDTATTELETSTATLSTSSPEFT